MLAANKDSISSNPVAHSSYGVTSTCEKNRNFNCVFVTTTIDSVEGATRIYLYSFHPSNFAAALFQWISLLIDNTHSLFSEWLDWGIIEMSKVLSLRAKVLCAAPKLIRISGLNWMNEREIRWLRRWAINLTGLTDSGGAKRCQNIQLK